MTNLDEKISEISNANGFADAYQILDRITDGFVALDRDWRYTYINRVGAQMAGRDPQEFIGRNIWEIYPEAVGTKFQIEYERAFSENLPVRFEEYLTSLDLWLEVSAYPSETGLSIFFRDVTEQKRAAAVLRESEELLQGTINALTGHIAVLDKDGVIIKVNEAWRRFAEENLFQGANYGIGQNYIEACILPAETEETDECNMYGIESVEGIRRVANGEIGVFEHEYPCHSPTEQRWYVMRVTRFEESNGDLRVVIAHENVTERKLVENALRENEERYRSLFDSIDEGFCVIQMLFDEAGNPFDYRFLELNPTFEEQTGLHNAEGKTARELVPNLEPRWFEIYGKVALTGRSVRFIEGSEAMNRWFNAYAFRIGQPEERLVALLFNDFTEQRRSEEKIRNSEKQLRLIADAMPGLISYIGKDFRYRFINKSYIDWFGLAPDEVVGKTTTEVLGAEAAEKIRPHIEAALQGKVEAFETEVTYKIAGKRFISATYTPDFGSDGTVSGIYVLVLDITERKKAEREIKRLGERNLEILESITDAFFAIDRDWRFTYVNPQAETLVGIRASDLVGKIFWEVYPSVIGSSFEIIYRRAMNEKIASTVTDFYPDHGRFYEVSVYPATNGVTVYFRNVTERVRANEILRESEERFRALQQATPDGFMMFESVRDESNKIADFRWVYINPAAEKIIGRKQGELLGKFLCEEMPGNRADGLFDEYARVVETGELRQKEFSYKHENLDHYFISTAVRVGDGFAIGFSDVTARRRVEEERERLLEREQELRLQAEQANRLKDEFLATVSHELRTPLNAILGWSSMLQSGKTTKEVRMRADETIYRSAKSQAQLIEDLLDVSRIITGKMKIEMQPVELASIVESAVETLLPTIEAKSIRLETDLKNASYFINGDAQRLQQTAWNLISNAVKFTPDGGTVKIEMTANEARVRLVVSDTGKGIEAEFLPFIFERFRQEDGSSTRRHGGLGLGLAIVRHLVKLHGGTISANSAGLDQGAVFTVELPLLSTFSDQHENQSNGKPQNPHEFSDEYFAEEEQTSNKLTGIRVLLVDDERDTLELLDTALAAQGAIVRTANSARLAFEIFKTWKPDILVSDIAMPDEDGYSLIARIRRIAPASGGKVPAIAMTAYVRAEDRLRVLSQGFQKYIPKPAEPHELVEIIADLFGK